MKKYLAAFFITIAVFICSPQASFAAFPIAHNSATTTSGTETSVTSAPAIHTSAKSTPAPHRRIRNKSQRWALIICCLVGYLGIHRYYLGYILEGCIQTVTLGGMGVWWIIDLIRICTGDLQPKDGKYMATF